MGEALLATYLGKKIKDRLEKEGRVRGFEARWKLRNKSSMYVMENARAIRNAEGRTLYYEGTVEDISERKQAEEALKTAATIGALVILGGSCCGKYLRGELDDPTLFDDWLIEVDDMGNALKTLKNFEEQFGEGI